jgi:hypothetical protein
VGEHDWSWHELGGFVAGVTEHDALVTGALFAMFFAFSFSGVDTLGDVGALDGEVVVDEDLVGVEDIVGVGVADAAALRMIWPTLMTSSMGLVVPSFLF